MSQWRRRLVVVMVAALAVVVLSPATAAARPGGASTGGGGGGGTPAEVFAVQFNLAGWMIHRGAPAPAQTVVDRVRAASPRPAVVSLNEVCSVPAGSGQWELVARELTTLGYSSHFAPSIPGLNWPGCTAFGNGLAVLGSLADVSVSSYQAQLFSSTAKEVRNIVCGRATPASGGPFLACSTHLRPMGDRPDVTRSQAAEALQIVRGRSTALGLPKRLVGGDFNLVPSDRALDGWYADHYEADRSLRTSRVQPTHQSGRKIDYVFGDRRSFDSKTTAQVTAVATSDHHWYEGRFRPLS